MSVTWRYLAGDTSTFAIELALVTDQTDDSMVDVDERASWGAFAIWIGGVNVCECSAQGETLQYAHWYLLPIAEWLVKNWDPLLHEERIPVAGRDNAADGFSRAAALAEIDPDDGRASGIEKIQAWYFRHGLRASAPGALLPDLYLRRYGDWIEFSTGREPFAGDDWGLIFNHQLRPLRLPFDEVANALEDAISALVAALRKRSLDNVRVEALEAQFATLRSSNREYSRFAWLSGAGDRLDAFSQLWRQIEDAIPEAVGTEFALSTPVSQSNGLVVAALPATLLFGSLSPDISASDIQGIFQALVAQKGADVAAADRLSELGAKVTASWNITGTSSGEQGSLYGETAYRILQSNSSRTVDIERVIYELGITVGQVALQDHKTRAVSMLGVRGTAHILINRTFQLGSSPQVQRFSLAHELGHLLLDQDRASRMVVASGPWAPCGIEQRANAFAAAFLIPIPLLDLHWSSAADALNPAEIRKVAQLLNVSFSALVSRLQNLGRIAPEDAEMLREGPLDGK